MLISSFCRTIYSPKKNGHPVAAARECTASRKLARGLELFLDSRGLTGQLTQVVELGTAHAAPTNDLDAGHGRRVEREDALDSDAARDLPDHEGLVDAPVLAGDADTLESLDALLGTLADEVEYPHGVAGSEVRTVLPELLLLDFLDQRI